MAINYAAISARIQTLIESNGRSLTLTKRATTAAVINSATPWRGNNASASPSTGGPISVNVIGVIVGQKNPEIAEDLVREGLLQCFVSQNSAVDVNGNAYDLRGFSQLVDSFDNTLYEIVSLVPFNPAGICIAYELMLKN